MASSVNLIVAALVRRNDGVLLVEQQGPDDLEPNWMLPGGRVEPGETLVAALARELAEETGLTLVGMPLVAFVVDLITDVGLYSALTFDADAKGALAPADPDGFVRRAEWVPAAKAVERLRCVAWYDCLPLERFLRGEASAGTVYTADRT